MSKRTILLLYEQNTSYFSIESNYFILCIFNIIANPILYLVKSLLAMKQLGKNHMKELKRMNEKALILSLKKQYLMITQVWFFF